MGTLAVAILLFVGAVIGRLYFMYQDKKEPLNLCQFAAIFKANGIQQLTETLSASCNIHRYKKVKLLLISPFFIKFALCSLHFCKEDTPFEKQKRNENEDGYNQNKELFYHRNVAKNRVYV